MSIWRIKLSLFLNYIVFAILLNSVGTVILEVINHYHITKSQAGNLDAYKDITIAIFSFIMASFLPRMGYKVSMLLGLALVSITCYLMPIVNSFWMIKLLLVSVGMGFALIKVSAYSTVALITKDEKAHASFISFLEGVFMLGLLFGYWLFSRFIIMKSTTWLDTYWVLGGLATAAFFLLASTKIDEKGILSAESGIFDDFIAMLKLNRHALVMIFVISIFMYVFIEQGINTWLPTFNNKVLNLSPAMSIEMASILAGTLALGRIVAGFILKKMSWFLVLAVFVVCAALMIIIVLPLAKPNPQPITQWKDAGLAAFLFPIIGFFLAPLYPTLCSTMLSTLPKYRHSSMMGLIMIYSALGGSLGSKLIGYTFGLVGGKFAISLTLIPMAIFFVLLFPYKLLRKAAMAKQKGSP